LDAKYLESTLMSNGAWNAGQVCANTLGRLPSGSEERDKENTLIEIVPNLGLKKKLFLPNNEGQFDNANSFKNLAETPLFTM
jgi:hypothetical protein